MIDLEVNKLQVHTEVNHLGVLIGDPNVGRIIAVSTSEVFADRSIIQTYRKVASKTIDSGFQGHLYTEPNDIFVVRVPIAKEDTLQKVTTTIWVNHELWSSLTGIQLVSPTSQIVLASDYSGKRIDSLPGNIKWHQGSLLDTATAHYKESNSAFLAFTFNDRVANMLGLSHQINNALFKKAETTTLLMNKNMAMQVLQQNRVNCAKSYTFNKNSYTYRDLINIPTFVNYVFKPAGGAAGIGVFTNKGQGASLEKISDYIERLKQANRLPHQFQIQEYIQGTPYGVSGYFRNDTEFKILEVHEQIINDENKFVGGRWTPNIQTEQMENANRIYQQLAAIEQLNMFGLMCLDMIDGNLIEVNPRLTASAPIIHILQQQKAISQHLGAEFRILQIDLNTDLYIPYELIENRKLIELIKAIWTEYKVLVLPQGLNPFGSSRFLFINDDYRSSAQQTFIRRIKQYSVS